MLTKPADLPVSDSDWSRAETMIAAYLGWNNLEWTQVKGAVQIWRGPMVTLPSAATKFKYLLLSGSDMTLNCYLITPWNIEVVAPLILWPSQTPFLPATGITAMIGYETGWKTEAEVPPGIRQAVISAAQQIGANPLGLSAERLGDVSNTYGSESYSNAGIPKTAIRMLGNWKKPGW